jgi:hypothetical protein
MVKSSLNGITGLVPMHVLLVTLGFVPGERTRRTCCILCEARNPSTFSWCEAGRWHCFRCHAGGDRIDLVKAVKHCSFVEAVDFLAALAGVEFRPRRVSSPQIERARLERKCSQNAARVLVEAERRALREARKNLRDLLDLRRHASARLKAIAHGAEPRWPGEIELAWQALQTVANELPAADAAYCLVSFAAPRERYDFVLHPERRAELVEAALERGFVATEKGSRIEVPQ